MHKLITLSHYTIGKIVTPIDPRETFRGLCSRTNYSAKSWSETSRDAFSGGESVLLETRRTRASEGEMAGARGGERTERDGERVGEAEAGRARLRRTFQFARQYFRRTPAELGVL